MHAKASLFEFSSYQYKPEQNRLFFHYRSVFENGEVVPWTETVVLPKPAGEIPPVLLESLHIMLGISYWKYYPSNAIQLPYALTKQQAEFFTTVYKKGLGEFFYRNHLDPNISPKFPFDNNAKTRLFSFPKQNRSLLGIGGGKDSIVSAELLKEHGFSFDAFYVANKEQEPLIENVIALIGAPSLNIQRILDPKVHQQHAYNGHIPISAIYAFLGILSCIAYGYDAFIVSNEYSSNFGNIRYKGLDVNHQWSKSFEFETLFQKYITEHVSPNVRYFSLLRPLHEIRIVKLFAKHKKYFCHFSSCNRNFAIQGKQGGGLWCCQCPKCVFAFTLLSAYLSKKQLMEIFGQNLYERKDLLPLFKDILGLGTMKPFDCVGTFAEAQTAFSMAGQTFLKSKIHPEVFGTSGESLAPDNFKLLGMETVSIVRQEGIEGQATKRFLKKYYPKLKIVVKDADITIKTPGVNKNQMSGLYTTPTNLFFSAMKGKCLIIGITGSKGKSTTTSLIYHILKAAGKKVEISGNIGKPMIEQLLTPVPTDRIFVLELSSFQLDDIHYSPDIAVLTNLFPEHMDYHGSLKNYYAAKKNIINFQSAGNYFVYNKKATAWLKNYSGEAIGILNEPFESNLIGQHNQSNINAAVQVARILEIPEATIKKAVKEFKGLPHRLQNIGTYNGITFYDDAISTTPDSTILAIQSLKNIGTIFLGGQDRGYDFSQLEKVIHKAGIKHIVLFPDSGRHIIKNKKGLHILQTKSMQEAMEFAYNNTKPGQICLLSCASPSYSLWKNFEEKGEQFASAVKKNALTYRGKKIH